MGLSEVIHNKSIDSEEGKSLANAEAAVPSEVTSGKGRCFLSLPISPEWEQELISRTQLPFPTDSANTHRYTSFLSTFLKSEQPPIFNNSTYWRLIKDCG